MYYWRTERKFRSGKGVRKWREMEVKAKKVCEKDIRRRYRRKR